MADLKFPMNVYNADGAVLQVNKQLDYDQAKAKGYGPRYVHSQFPKMVYCKANGSSKVVTSEAELAALGDEWTEEFVAAPAPKAVPLQSAPESNDAGMKVLFAQLRDALNRLDHHEERLEALENAPPAAPAPESGKKGKKSDKAEEPQ